MAKRSFRFGLPILVAATMVSAAQSSATASEGVFVKQVHFDQACPSGIGVGIAFDNLYLWYSCYATGGDDLFRADPRTGAVSASYNIAGGLGALTYDGTRNAIWAGWGGSYDPGNVYLIQLDDAHGVLSSTLAFNTGPDPLVCGLDDGMQYDGTDDSLYISDDCSTTVWHFETSGNELGSSSWAGNECYNSGLAQGGDIMFEASSDCAEVVVTDKASPSVMIAHFATDIAPGDERDEDMECDTHTFHQGHRLKDVIWIKQAYTDVANAFAIPLGSCGVGGLPPG
jgi:hypothetical protein